MAQKRGAEVWGRHLEEWKGSGLTQVAYCAHHGISLKSFQRWLRRERRGESAATEAVTLVPIRLEEASVGGTLTLHSPGGWRIELTGASVAQWAELVKALP